MSLDSVKKFIANIDYKWSKPETYLVFVPLVSLVIQKVQMANVLPLLQEGQPLAQMDTQSRKFVAFCKGHLIGSIMQGIVIAGLITTVSSVASPVLLLIGSLLLVSACLEFSSTYYKGIKTTVTVCHGSCESGVPKSADVKSAFAAMFS